MNYAELKGTRREWNNMGNEAIFGRYIKEWIDIKSCHHRLEPHGVSTPLGNLVVVS